MGKTPPQTPTISPPRNLPPRLTVPPLPPRIHRRLNATVTTDGVVLRPLGPTAAEEGVLVRWGPRGKVETLDAEDKDAATDAAAGVEIGGVLGIVRLWDGESGVGLCLSALAPRQNCGASYCN